jgi:hypothetical protein
VKEDMLVDIQLKVGPGILVHQSRVQALSISARPDICKSTSGRPEWASDDFRSKAIHRELDATLWIGADTREEMASARQDKRSFMSRSDARGPTTI